MNIQFGVDKRLASREKTRLSKATFLDIAYHGGDPTQLKRVNKVGVSGKPTSASNLNPSAVSVLREIHSSWCLHRIRKALRPIA